MPNLTEELKELNDNARLLLSKYDGVFTKLNEEKQALLIEIAQKGEEGLSAITELLESGNVAQAENALKLGGKSLDEVLTSSSVGVLQVAYAQLDEEWITSTKGFVTALSVKFDKPIKDGSKVLIRATGHLTAGTEADNWGAMAFLGVNNIPKNRGNDKGNYMTGGATDMSGYASGGNHFAMECLVSNVESDDSFDLIVNKDSTINKADGWEWIALGRSTADYGQTVTSLTIMEIGA